MTELYSDSGTDLLKRDSQSVWHPFTQYGLERDFLPVVSGSGSYLKLADGKLVLDAISSWWVNIHGHAHPAIAEAIARQARELEHVIFAGFTHEPAVKLAEILLSAVPIKKIGLSRVFYSDNGSTAVEVALKMAYQYHLNTGQSGRDRFLALSDSYHGDTLGAMAVGEPSGYHSQFRRLMPPVDFVQPGDIEGLQELLSKNRDSYAAFIFEPLVQGAAGMKMYSPEFLKEAVRLCQAEGVLAIADEVFTGFYRTGRCFAFEYAGIEPDLVCLSKGITGGFLPLAVTLSSEKIFQGFITKELRHAFLHGHSYTANPISCAAALASWQLLQSTECQDQIQSISDQTRKEVEALQGHPRVKSARCLGTIGAIELREGGDLFSVADRGQVKAIKAFALDRGVLLRPTGNVIYSVPPYCTQREEIRRIYKVVSEYLDQAQ